MSEEPEKPFSQYTIIQQTDSPKSKKFENLKSVEPGSDVVDKPIYRIIKGTINWDNFVDLTKEENGSVTDATLKDPSTKPK